MNLGQHHGPVITFNMSKQRQNHLNSQAKHYEHTLPFLKDFIEVPRELPKVASQMKQNNAQRD